MKPFTATITALQDLDPRPLLDFVQSVRGGTFWICGNGGSFSTAQHWACDLVKAAGVRAVALGSNGALLTAYANDIAYVDVFAQELRRVGVPGDALIALSCSGTSPNITRVLQAARVMGIATALLTGTVNEGVADADLVLRVWSKDYGVIEDCHLAIGHWLTKELQS